MKEIRPAATVMLLREKDDHFEVLLLRRNRKLKFGPGFWVFAGGKIEEEDIMATQNDVEAAKLAAVREAQEEAGVEVNTADIHYFCHWTTPPMQSKRFATSFFISILPKDQADHIVIDDGEIKEYMWAELNDALRRNQAREFPLLPPTFLAIQRFSKCKTKQDILQEILKVQPKVLPTVCIQQQDPPILHYVYEGDAAYKNGKYDTPGPRHRLVGAMDGGYEFHYENCEVLAVNGGNHV